MYSHAGVTINLHAVYASGTLQHVAIGILPHTASYLGLVYQVNNLIKGLISQEGYTVYALTFTGLNFHVFVDQQPFAKVSSCKNLDLAGNESAFVRRFRNKHAKMAAIR